MNLVRSISFKRRAKKIEKAPTDQTPGSSAAVSDSPQIKAAKVGLAGLFCPQHSKDEDKPASEAPFAVFVKTISTEIVKSVSKESDKTQNLEGGKSARPLAPVIIHPRDVLSTINVKEVTESVAGVLMELMKKLAEEWVMPVLQVLRLVLMGLLGDKFPSVIAWVESTVRSFVELVSRVLFSGQDTSKVESWAVSLTSTLLKALLVPNGLDLEHTLAEPSADAEADTLCIQKDAPAIHQKLSVISKAKLGSPSEESIEDSLKATLEDFIVCVDEAWG